MNQNSKTQSVDTLIRNVDRNLRLVKFEWPALEEDEASYESRTIEKRIRTRTYLDVNSYSDDDDFDPAA